MVKVIGFSIGILLLSGCAMTPNANTSSAPLSDNSRLNEAFLEQSKNYPRLIDLYKEQLKQKENADTRLKLAQIYVDTKDFESALFTLMPMIRDADAPASVFYLQGVSLYGVGKLEQAQQSLLIAVKRAPDDAKTVNMLGVVQAEQGDLVDARQSFLSARGLMYDDITVKNNLALLDMIEGDFKQAAARLMPIYIANPAKVDAQVKANLAIIVSKLGSFESLKSIYSGKYSEAELFEIFQNLRASEPATRTSTKAISSKTNVSQPIKSSQSVIQPQFESTVAAQSEMASSSDAQPQPSSQTDRVQPMASVASNSLSSMPARQASVSSEKQTDGSMLKLPAIDEAIDSELNTEIERPSSVLLSELVTPTFEESMVLPGSQALMPNTDVTRKEERRSFTELTGISRRYETTVEPLSEVEVNPLVPPQKLQPVVNSTFNEQSKDEQATKESEFSSLMGIERRYASAAPQSVETSLQTSSLEDTDEPTAPEGAKIWSKPEVSNNASAEHDFVKLATYSLVSDGVSEIPVAQFRHRGYLIDVTFDEQGNMINVE
ncbi:tetratricopeptide repeat protein [Marinomonas ostreistagni]|uniref:Tetratricopeptide repeat protein n=1 Tax=Marinomonas ostreistagni TaxID=359209 RepID=A0ABS0ZCT7_9GAMM|nr:tetratricopeptide repeat protein [Marinomonas ostreistagni]MBJ7551484.1 tetratricopeptide repeat protein [Marinomonas ostreistagni]